VLTTEPGLSEVMARALVTAMPADGEGITELPGDERCRRFHPGGPDGRRLTPNEIITAWEQALRGPDPAADWLLQPVRGAADVALGTREHASGLRVEGDAVVICTVFPTPDWEKRLEHPALWPLVRHSPGAAEWGGGAFRRQIGMTELERAVPNGGNTASVDRISFVHDIERDVVSRLESGEIDLAVVYGRTAQEIPPRSPLRKRRLEAWDKVYALWVDPQARWVNDPVFRRWIAARIDRESMARYLFGEQAQATGGLLDREVHARSPVVGRPFSSTSSPRLSLSFDARDPHAASIAARVKAVLERESPNLRLELVDDAGRPRDGSQLVLLGHHPPVSDPLLSLLDTLWPLRGMAAEDIRRLLRATRIDDDVRRRARALEIERRLIEDARLLPLVRLHAWLVDRSGLSGVDVGRYGVLRLENAEWVR
jgi:hypothetical protein